MIQKYLKITILSLFAFNSLFASDWVDAYVLTDKIIVLHFKDGFIHYNGYLQDESHTQVIINPADINAISSTFSYLISSSEDSDYGSGINPLSVGRKSKGFEFSNQCNWVNSTCDNEVVFEHYIYLILEHPLEANKTYEINISEGIADNFSTQHITYNPEKTRSGAIHVNQIGFMPSASKKYAYLSHWMGDAGPLDLDDYEGATFHLINQATQSSAFQGTISKRMDIETSDYIDLPQTPNQGFLSMSDVWECDFSQFNVPGEYILSVEGIGCSFPFKIEDNIYKEPYYLVTRQLYHQRAGIELKPEFTEWTRPRNLHPDDGRIKFQYTESVWTDWTGSNRENGIRQEVLNNVQPNINMKPWGWYMDAGDWDGYYNHTKVPRYLMTAYELAPQNFTDSDLNLPESGNGLPDILDEAQWLLNYLNRTRGPTGGVAGARIHPDFEQKENDFIPSWEDTRTWLISGEDPVTTYTFAGMAAHFAYCLELSNHPDSLIWKNRAIEAYTWASENEEIANSEFVNGRLYGAAMLYKLTGDEDYELQYIADRPLPETRNESYYNLEFADWAYLSTQHEDRDISFWNSVMQENVQAVQQGFIETSNSRSFRAGWRPNFKTFLGQATTPQIFPALVLYYLTGDHNMQEAALTSVDYVLGGNPLDMSWVVGIGDNYPKELLHLDTWYHPEGRSDFYIPGSIPYGPTTYGLGWPPNNGPWSSDFAWDRVYPSYETWPLHEGFFNNKLAVPTNEYTIHQTTAPAAAVFGLLSGMADASFVPNQRPNIELSISNPTSNGVVTLNATATDSDGYIQKVIFYKNGHKIGEAKETPFQINDVNSNSSSEYTATAIDNEGAKSRVKKNIVFTQEINLNTSSLYIDVGENIALAVNVEPTDITIPGLYWETLNKEIATVDNGSITGVTPGRTTILVRSVDGRISKQIEVLVGDTSEIVLFPNPVTDGKLFIANRTVPAQINIWSITGEALLSFEMTKSLQSIDLSYLNSGVYMVEIVNSRKTITRKIIISH